MNCNDNGPLPFTVMYDYSYVDDYEDGSFHPSHDYPYPETVVLPVTDYVPQYDDSVANSFNYRQQNSHGYSAEIPYIPINTWAANDSQRSSPSLSCETSKDRTSVSSPSTSEDGDDTTLSTEASKTDRDTIYRDGRYFCSVRDCKNKQGFAREHDLKRHHCQHKKPSWFCGCCIYGRNKRPYNASRKDHMLTHLRKIHGMIAPFPCEERSCRSGGILIFSSLGCLRQHFRAKHSQYGLQKPSGQEMIVANQVSPTLANLVPLPNVFTSSDTGHPVSQPTTFINFTTEASNKSYFWNGFDPIYSDEPNGSLMIPRSITTNNNALPVSTVSDSGSAYTATHPSFSSSAPLYNPNDSYQWISRGMNDIAQDVPLVPSGGASGMARSRSVPRVTKLTRYPAFSGTRLHRKKQFNRDAKRTHRDEPDSDQMPCKNCRRYADVLGLNGETVIEHSLLPDLPVTRAERQKPQPVESRSALFLNAARESRLEEPAFLPTTTYTAGFSRSTYGAHSVKIHNEVLEFDRTFDNPAESQEMVTTATSSSTGWSCGEIVQTTALPATVPVSQQLWNADHITLQLEQLKVEEVRNVHPADFLALFKTDGLRSINELLISAIPAVGLADTPSIWYNSHKQTVKLKGPAGVIEQARTRLETGLKDIYCRAGLQHILGPHSKWSSALAKQYGSASKISVNRKSDQKPPKRIFDLRANEEDGKLVALWTRHISPALHGILSPRLGQNYAASFVRLGSSEASAHAYIRIQSECRQSQSIKAEIRAEIAKICDAVEQCHVVSQFSVGKVVLLGKSSIASSSGDEGCENDDTDLCDFPWYKRWWEKPGMGASIGLRCSNSVSATLGGYVVINNQPYLLTVDHFIDKARRHQDGATATTLDPLALTSPSLLDVKDMIASLEQSIRNVKADIAKLFNNLGSQDLLLDCMQQLYDDGGDLRQWYDILDFFDTLLKELRKDEQQFVLGRVEYRCVLKAREPSSYNETPLPYSDENPIVHRMDWALCRVNSARWGVNRHRYGSDKVPMDYLCPNTEPHGLGELCQDTCDPESYTHVYFVGQKSGINHGRIGSSLTNCCVNGIPTREWSIIVPHPVSDENIFAGDSGAWILRERDHRVVGQLWGYKDGLLLFTAINVIFADIMDSLGTRNVGLQNRYLNPDTSTIYNDSAMDNPALICEYKKPKQRKPKGYRISPGTTMMPRKTSLKIGPRLAFSDILSVVTPFEPAIPNNCAAADIVPGSPVPSLASSASSSTGPGPKTPDDCHDTKIERRSLSGLDLLAQLAKHHVNTRTDNRDEIEVAANDERDSTIYSIQAPRDRPHDDMADKTDKHSLSFILRDVQPEMKFNSIHLPDLYPFTGFRKSHTFPMYNEPLKPQPQTSVTAVA